MTFAADGTFTGNAGCNVVNGTYTTSGSSLTIVPGPMTLRACIEPAATAQEQALTTGLPNVSGYVVTGPQLTMTNSSGSTLFTFARGTEGLTGTSWTVTGVNNGNQALVSTPATPELTLTFGADGRVGGFGGCNSWGTPYTVEGDTLTVSRDILTTLVNCEPEANKLEQQYQGALIASTKFEISSSTLTLRDATGALQVTATAV